MIPTSGGSAPTPWMSLTGQLVDTGPLAADVNGFSAVALRRRHEPDAAVAVLIVVPGGSRETAQSAAENRQS